MAASTYAQDVAFLRKHTRIVELGGGAARVAVAPDFQGRAMTSTLGGPDGASFGWLNRPFIEAGAEDAAFNNYGGEDRFWLGPEAGQFGLWFAPGEPFDTAHWKTPPGFNSGPFEVTGQAPMSVAMTRRFRVTNYAGTAFDCSVQRTINALDAAAAGKLLGTKLPAGLKLAAFESVNTLTNAGEHRWTREGGMLSIWTLGQFKPLPHGKVIVPFRPGGEADFGPKATTDYFGPLPPQRCEVGEEVVLFTCDGRFRSKIGINPRRSKGIIGSYDADAKVLTIVQFNQPPTAAELPYVNSLWQIQDDPFAGDAINSYNDGEERPGCGQLGPFYEIETSSPAASLPPGKSITHAHRTFHFAGEAGALGDLAVATLGADLGRTASGT